MAEPCKAPADEEGSSGQGTSKSQPPTPFENVGKRHDPYFDHNSATERKIRRAMRAARSELSVSMLGWQRRLFADDPAHTRVDNIVDLVPRVHASTMTPASFFLNFDAVSRPCVITGLCDEWPCYKEQWSVRSLAARYPNLKMKIGTDDDGYAVKLKLKHYAAYADSPFHRRDDSPLYVFDGAYHDNPAVPDLVAGYSVPHLLQEDLLSLLKESHRPPYRWLVMGPPRSGTQMHTDPLGTSAWNSLISGRKRWLLLPPGIPKDLLIPKGLEKEGVAWYARAYRMVKSHPILRDLAIELVQHPGETLFVPCNWWHVVLNVDDAVAVTQNFISSANVINGWRSVLRGRPALSRKWRRLLARYRPDIDAVLTSADAELPPPSEESSSSDSSSSVYSSATELPPPHNGKPGARYKCPVSLPPRGFRERPATVAETLELFPPRAEGGAAAAAAPRSTGT
eukprot:TRINITY_DN4242_c0_g1_i2.p1 TRINITY_DN4242_c0_g1~~TRINITY_DN4242_c0_g1_i2.p1  ORF type:complete len:464 (+),score=77.53 TRINITY_DN4242_c0_g1_i2:33-1394(+)